MYKYMYMYRVAGRFRVEVIIYVYTKLNSGNNKFFARELAWKLNAV